MEIQTVDYRDGTRITQMGGTWFYIELADGTLLSLTTRPEQPETIEIQAPQGKLMVQPTSGNSINLSVDRYRPDKKDNG